MELKTIVIPQTWDEPRLGFGKLTELGLIIGMRYYPFGSYLANEYGEGWRYILMPDKDSDQEKNCTEDEIAPIAPDELRRQLEAEIAKKLRDIELLTQELKAIATTNL